MPGKAERDPDRITRVCRLYRTNREARAVLGLGSAAFLHLCRSYNIETPHQREERRQGRLAVQVGARGSVRGPAALGGR